jgi:hypothetical protein
MLVEVSSPSLPAAVLHSATAILLLLLIRAVLKTPHAAGRLLLVIVWLRYVMQAYHQVTYTSVGGVSINALGSLAVCVVGAIVLLRQLASVGRFPVIVSLMVVVAISGIMNNAVMPAIETLLKWGYFIIVMLALEDCIRRDGDTRILGLLLWAFAPPLVYQALSIGLGISKATESDGSISFIGGYNHEAAFSIVLVTCFAVASLTSKINPVVRLLLLAACFAGIFAANYRTSLIALAPLAFGFFVFGIARGAGGRGRRVIVSLIGLLAMAGAGLAANMATSDRLADLNTVADESDDLVRPPEEFTAAERKLLSGRLYVWNQYLDEYVRGTDRELLVGFGPDSWIERFGLYAHNTIVSYLYEFGTAGAVLIVLIWLGMILRTFRIRDWALRGQLICAHIAFILLNMATMPFWQIEGLILYGLLCGYTICVSAAPALRRETLLDSFRRPRRTQMGPAAPPAPASIRTQP